MQPNDRLESHFRLLTGQKVALMKLGLKTVRDLLYHFPSRYEFLSNARAISTLKENEVATVYGQITKLETGKTFRGKMPKAEGVLEDHTGKIKIIWFRQPYIAKMIPEGSFVRVSGKVSLYSNSPSFTNPEIEKIGTLPLRGKESLFGEGVSSGVLPIYGESKGITSRWFFHALSRLFHNNAHGFIEDPIPEEIRKRYNLPSLKSSLLWVHVPRKEEESSAARKRFAFEEVFFIQLSMQSARAESKSHEGMRVVTERSSIDGFLKRFPFTATNGQKKSIESILKDFESGRPMSRLLEGDVGSGKTAVAATAAYAVSTSRIKEDKSGYLQVAYMAPTEILAGQHFESFIKYFSYLNIPIALITGSGCKKFPSKVNPNGWTNISRTQLSKWVANGEIPIVIGTHALIQKNVAFKNLALVIIDEQHRFGTGQRQKLARKGDILPHLLTMTATPIPRTLALTLYGDLDLSLLDEMPVGRKQIQTQIVPPGKRKEVYEKMREELQKGLQAYVICPRINEPDPDKEMALIAKSVQAEARTLKKIFPEYKIETLHSKMKSEEKDRRMENFSEKRIDILVATSVVEVGINVPNATVIIIEGAERFGLSQLHQLRGRVMRSSYQPYCYLFTEGKAEKTKDRLNALMKTRNGFELAEEDLRIRGAGELTGRKQWGISDIGMEAMKNLKMVEAAREEARKIVTENSSFSNYPLIQKRVLETSQHLHLE